jgi:hypothetical protein
VERRWWRRNVDAQPVRVLGLRPLPTTYPQTRVDLRRAQADQKQVSTDL